MVLVEGLDAPAQAQQTFVDVGSFIDAGEHSISPLAASQVHNPDDHIVELDSKDSMGARTLSIELGLVLAPVVEVLLELVLHVGRVYRLGNIALAEIQEPIDLSGR